MAGFWIVSSLTLLAMTEMAIRQVEVALPRHPRSNAQSLI